MHVLITGGAGFLGQAITRNLSAAGHAVTVLTRRQPTPGTLVSAAQVVVADLRSPDDVAHVLDGQRYEGVCHVAALTRVRDSFAHPLDYYAVNVSGTINLLHALSNADRNPPAFVFASTAAVYGNSHDGALNEELPTDPQNPYAASKVAAEQLLEYHSAATGMRCVTLRCFNIAGAVDGIGDRDSSRIIPRMLDVAAGLVPTLTVNGDGTAVREYTHVADVAAAFRLALESAALPGYHVLNVGTGQGLSIQNIIQAGREITDKPITVDHQPAKPEAHRLVSDSARLYEQLHWRPTRSDVRTIVADAWRATAA